MDGVALVYGVSGLATIPAGLLLASKKRQDGFSAGDILQLLLGFDQQSIDDEYSQFHNILAT